MILNYKIMRRYDLNYKTVRFMFSSEGQILLLKGHIWTTGHNLPTYAVCALTRPRRVWPYCDACAAEGLVDALQVVRQQVQQAGRQENSSSEAADQTEQPAAQICNIKNQPQPNTYCRLTVQTQ